MFSNNSSIPFFLQFIVAFMVLIVLLISAYFMIYIGNRHVDYERRININWRKFSKIILFIFLSWIIFDLFAKYSVLRNTAISFGIAVIIAFIINPLVNKLETYKIKRGLGTLIVYLGIVLVFVLLGISVIPRISSQISGFINNFPNTLESALNKIKDLMIKFKLDSHQLEQLQGEIMKYLTGFTKNIDKLIPTVYSSITGSIGKLITLILVPILTYYLVVDKDKILNSCYKIIPKKHRDDAKVLYVQINQSMSEIVRGRLIMAVFVGIVTGIMLAILKIEFAFIIGIITMVADIIPYIGPFMGFTPAFVFALLQSPVKAFWVGVLFVFIQWAENNLLGPKVLGDTTGLHPLVILVSIIIFGGMMGVWGMVLAVPIASLITIAYDFIKSKLYG
ncbi:AI-2E family transporter [Peptoniphilaceae bacterium SGI.131]